MSGATVSKNGTVPEVSVILPVRNEEESLSVVLEEIFRVYSKHNINGEIIVSDSSSDKSPEIAGRFGVILVKHNKEGYGIAYMEGIKCAHGRYIFMADADGTYEFSEIPNFIAALEENNDLVVGNRFAYHLDRGVMPWHHKYIGNPLLSFVLRIFFKAKIRDAHCGMRAITRDAYNKLHLQTTGMEFASEMLVKATFQNLKIKELPIKYKKRIGKSKLKSISDGWRHLRFMLLYSPLYLFFLPGASIFLLGIVSMVWLYIGDLAIFGVPLFFHPMFVSALLVIFGYQVIVFSFFAKSYAMVHFGERSQFIENLHKYLTLERASIFGITIAILGGMIFSSIFLSWIKGGFPELHEAKNFIVALILITIGMQTVFSSFMLSILGIKDK